MGKLRDLVIKITEKLILSFGVYSELRNVILNYNLLITLKAALIHVGRSLKTLDELVNLLY